MERITKFNKELDCYEVLITIAGDFTIREETEKVINGCIISPRYTFLLGKSVDKLAEYENTGFTPKEIESIKKLWGKRLIDILTYDKKIQQLEEEVQKLRKENHDLNRYCTELCEKINKEESTKINEFMCFSFSERRALAIEYTKWAKENKVKNCPFSVITFLKIRKLLKGGAEE